MDSARSHLAERAVAGLVTLADFVRRVVGEMSTEPLQPNHEDSLELPVKALLRRARPLPSPDDMVIDDLTEAEGDAFLAALEA